MNRNLSFLWKNKLRVGNASIAERIHTKHSRATRIEFERELMALGVPTRVFGYDWYDNSIEIYDVPPMFRLTKEQLDLLREAKFSTVYVNHKDKWETHYSFYKGKYPEGWRVSYPHKRTNDETGILVEEKVEGWPAEWFETGYAKVVEK